MYLYLCSELILIQNRAGPWLSNKIEDHHIQLRQVMTVKKTHFCLFFKKADEYLMAHVVFCSSKLACGK